MSTLHQPLDDKKTSDNGSQKCKCGVCQIVSAAVLVVLVVLIVIYWDNVVVCWGDFELWCETIGLWACAIIIVLCYMCEVLSLPSVIMFVASGVIFDKVYSRWVGLALASGSCCVGIWFGSLTAFYLGRTTLKPKIEKQVESVKMLCIINKIIKTEGLKFAFLMRLSPLLPIEPFNYACSLTSMSAADNAVACFGTFPVVTFEVYLSATAAHYARDGAPKDDTDLYVSIGLNVTILLVMCVLFFTVKKKYDNYEVEFEKHEEEIEKPRHSVSNHIRASVSMIAIPAHPRNDKKTSDRGSLECECTCCPCL